MWFLVSQSLRPPLNSSCYYKFNSFHSLCVIGARKSLLNVFQDGNCHPKMAMVIDDRLKVWEDKDQPRVHVVPAFTPYYAPQAEVSRSRMLNHVVF